MPAKCLLAAVRGQRVIKFSPAGPYYDVEGWQDTASLGGLAVDWPPDRRRDNLKAMLSVSGFFGQPDYWEHVHARNI